MDVDLWQDCPVCRGSGLTSDWYSECGPCDGTGAVPVLWPEEDEDEQEGELS